MEDSRLYHLLKQFTSKEAHTEEELNGKKAGVVSFKDIAQELIFGGAFELTYKNADGSQSIARIRIVDAEAYYFDDKNDNGVRDWSMYHRNRWTRTSQEPSSPAYLPIGAFYPHNSGIDLTFESKEHGFRASFLLRSFQPLYINEGTVIPDINEIEWNNQVVENRPTHLYDCISPALNPLDTDSKIAWVQFKDKPKELPATAYRKSVAMFAKRESGKGEPLKMTKSLYQDFFEDGKHIITQDGKSIQDTKRWRFFDPNVRQNLEQSGAE